MAVRDLLWACPLCHARGALRPAGKRADACDACGTRFERADGARIRATRPDGRVDVRSPQQWSEALGLPERSALAPNDAGEILRARASRRAAHDQATIRARGGEVLGFREIYGDAVKGALVLTPQELRFEPDAGTAERWPLGEIRALSASSSTLQIRVADGAVVAIRFEASSLRLWEEHVSLALREFYRAAGKGEIREFQPRIEVG